MNPQVYFSRFILFAPLVSALVIQLFTRKHRSLSATFSVTAVCLALVASIFTFFGPDATSEIPWLDFGPAFRVPIGLTLDHLSKVMLLIVTGVGALVHIYSLVYMGEDESEGRYFGNMSLFMFSMLGIVLANNFGMMFIFWELVGVSSYLLIGHWFTRETAAAAANKAFITNRIGDFGFMLGILMIWGASGTLVFSEMQAKMPALTAAVPASFLTITVLLIFCGAVGKSAQVPLHVWLPDAMEGPTPVSALIHAATMVAAGVYMLARISFLIAPTPNAQTVIAAVGAITSLFAALVATQQDDIKRILAYSTLSQLGYMIMSIGLNAPGVAMFHLYTHAFFKALLFLGAGAIIHALHHEQDIWKMGGLSKRMKWTFFTFTAGYLALIGFPGTSGFFSKDAILLQAYKTSLWFFIPAVLTAFLTAFYMTRMWVVVFWGNARTDAAKHGHDGPLRMTGPMVILGVLSIGSAYFTSVYFIPEPEGARNWIVLGLAVSAFLAGFISAVVLYKGQSKDPILIPLLKQKLYIDELYAALIAGSQDLLAAIAGWFDKWILDGVIVRGLSGAAWGLGFVLRFFQFGNLQAYTFLFGVGVVAMIYLLVFR